MPRELANGAIAAPAEARFTDERPALHVGLYGDAHAGKTYLLALILLALAKRGWPPGYIAFFDRGGKELTLELVWKRAGVLTKKSGIDKRQTPWTDYFVDGLKIARVGFYAMAQVELTDGAARLTEHFPVFEQELLAGKWGTYALDSLTYMQYDARKQSQYVDNPTTAKGNKQNAMQHYGFATDVAEDFVLSRIGGLGLGKTPCNTFCLMHESKVLVESEGKLVRSVAVPGKRLASTNMIASTFPELWRLYATRTDEGKKTRQLQTQSDDEWQAGTVIGVPDGAKPSYDGLWLGWEK